MFLQNQCASPGERILMAHGKSCDQLQRTGSVTPSSAQALTTEKIKTEKQAVPLYWQGHVLFCFSVHVTSTDMLVKFE